MVDLVFTMEPDLSIGCYRLAKVYGTWNISIIFDHSYFSLFQ